MEQFFKYVLGEIRVIADAPLIFILDAHCDRLHSCVVCGPKGTALRRRTDSWPTFRHWRYRQGRIESERHGHPGRKISMIPFISIGYKLC
jgi:hypothetical protein